LLVPLSQFMDSTIGLNGVNPPMVMLLLTSCRIGFTPFSSLFPLVTTESFPHWSKKSHSYSTCLDRKFYPWWILGQFRIVKQAKGKCVHQWIERLIDPKIKFFWDQIFCIKSP
jgi:hypothetical protein